MKKILFYSCITIMLQLFFIDSTLATKYRSSGSGNFSGTHFSVYDNNLQTWLGSNQPFFYAPFQQTNDTITIMEGDSIYLDVDVDILGSYAHFEVYGKLNCNNHYLSGQLYNAQTQTPGSYFTLHNGATLYTSHPHGTACIQNFSPRIFEDSANYEFNGNHFNFDPLSSNYNNPQYMFDFYKPQLNVGNISIKTVDTGQKVLPNFNSFCHNYKINGSLIMRNGKLTFSNDTINLAFGLIMASFNPYGGPTTINTPTLTIEDNCSVFVTSDVYAEYSLPTSVKVLKELQVNVCEICKVELNNNLRINTSNGVKLIRGKIKTGSFYLKLDVGEVIGGNSNRYVQGKLIQKLETITTSNTQYLFFPIGGESYQPIGLYGSTLPNQGNEISAQVFETSPTGTGDDSTVTEGLSNIYWNIKNEDINPQFLPDYIYAISGIELQPNGLIPALNSSKSIVAVSGNNSASSYQGINSSVSSPYINSLQLNNTQKSQITTFDGLFISIGKRTLAPGVYCIGPSSSYSPPAGSNYVYKNANKPYGNITAAMNDLNASNTSGNITFEIQNNYTGYTSPPANIYENNPITISYEGSPTRSVNIRVRNDLTGPLNIINNRPHTSTIGVIHLDGAKYVSIDGTLNGSSCSVIKGLRVLNSGSPNWSTNCISFNNGAENCQVKGLQLERDYGNGIYLDCSVGSTGCSNISIECNKILPRTPNVNAGMSIRNSFAGGSNKNENIFIKNNYFEGAVQNIYIGSSNARGLWEITNNHFYEPSGHHIGTFFSLNPTDTATIKVNNNFFGGTAAFCSGNKMDFNLQGSSSISTLESSINPSEFSGNHIENLFDNTSDPFANNGTFFTFNTCGFKIDNNVFGSPFAAQSISSSVLYNFIGFYVSQNSNNNKTTSISGNTFNNIYYPATANYSCGSCGYFSPIQIYRNNNGTGSMTTTINDNEFKHIHTGAGYGVSMINTNSYGGLNQIRNNIIEDLNIVNNGTQNIDIIKSASGSSEVVNNRIGSITVSDDVQLKGGYVFPFNITSNAGSFRFDSNTVSNVKITSPYTFTRCMSASSNAIGLASYSFNKIENVNYYMNLSSSAIIDVMYFTSNNPNPKAIHNNIINHVEQLNPTTVGPITLTGINLNATGNISVNNNEVYNLQNLCFYTTTLPSTIGINIQNQQTSLSNNMVCINHMYGNAIELFGIKNNASFNVNIKHNTVYIGGSSLGNSFAYYKQNVPFGVSGDTIKNNIFYNARNGGGNNYAIGRNTIYSSLDIGICDYNNLYSSTSTTLGLWYTSGGGLTFSQWKSASGQDVHSKNSLVKFLHTINNLHINTNTNCGLNGMAQPNIGVSSDVDDELRNADMPDIGADEFTPNPIEFATASSNSPLCVPDNDIHLQANYTSNNFAPYTYQWNGPNSFSSVLSAPTITSPTQVLHQGIYTITMTDAYGCTATSSTNVVLTTPQTWYLDIDGDAYYTGNAITACISPGIGYTTSVFGGNDCNDANPNINSAAMEICGNNLDDNCDGNVDEGCMNPYNIKAFIEGYYVGAQTMQSVLYNQGETLNNSLCDSVLLTLLTEPFENPSYSKMLPINTSGILAVSLPANLFGTQQYIILKHRNSIETWSASKVSLVSNGTYDFSSSASQAFGSNQLEIEPGIFAMYSGDIDQDGIIELADYSLWEADANNFEAGYRNADLNGNGAVDISDYSFWEANANNFVGVVKP